VAGLFVEEEREATALLDLARGLVFTGCHTRRPLLCEQERLWPTGDRAPQLGSLKAGAMEATCGIRGC
jgi:hypothetical protein